ncbi:MAG TPA: 1-deoxy-D-xylulose-5-phosphate reductoisomerase, partial [Chloroflexia bacterium]|nr:1-deoxy-D-xylulose-5-phosphate reductoisomerase [Chloroflexia bacterium]
YASEEAPIGIALLGCTGSIGTQTLAVLRELGAGYRVVTLAAGRDAAALAGVAAALPAPPLLLALGDPAAPEARDPAGHPIPRGEAALVACATHPAVDLVVVATSGQAGFAPTLAALAAGKQIALANKEVLVMAGELVTAAARQAGALLRPVDSEHSAIWQSLQGETVRNTSTYPEVERIIVTASGGPFRTWPLERMRDVTPEQALKHPNWAMGAKITIDSATLANKGLEVIEAHWLFDLPYDQIDVLVHPQSIIHSMVEFRDGAIKAQLGVPDMRVPIQYALTWPRRAPNRLPRVDWGAISQLDFEAPDLDRFPLLRLCREAGRQGGTFPTVLAAADEEAVYGFMRGQWGFLDIPRLVEQSLADHVPAAVMHPDLTAIKAADAWARDRVSALAASWRTV